MIDIQTNNVTIDFNGFKLGGLAAGPGTAAQGIFARDRKNITLRNGSIRGFQTGILLEQTVADISSGHLVEDMLLDGNRATAIIAKGSGMIIRRNRVVNTGSSTRTAFAIGIAIGGRNSVIADNVVSGTSETQVAAGISVNLSALIEVRGNTILDTRDATVKRGIEISTSTDITLVGNRILNDAGTGTNGITGPSPSSSAYCIDNTIAGFAIALTGCDFSAGNNIVP